MPTITPQQTLCIARQHAERGRLADAEGLCRRLLRDDANCCDALQLLGEVIAQAGRSTQAIPFLSRAAQQKVDDFELHLHLARVCASVDQLDEAIDAYGRCASISPGSLEPHAQSGILLNRSGRYIDAISALARAVELSPESAELHFHLGVALSHCDQTIRAVAAYKRAIELDPRLPEPHANLGVLYRSTGQLALALDSYKRALTLNSGSAEVHCNLGVALAELQRMDEAVRCYEAALSLDPAFVNAHYNLANTRRKADEHELAIKSYQRAIEIKPDFVQALSNMAMSFNDIGRHDLALLAYDRAVELRPDMAEARWNRSLTHLLLGDFERGWAEFDCRNQIEPPSSRSFPGERWEGQELLGKTILLHYEMGLGDSIQFARFVESVAKRGGRVILECQATLHELFRSIAGASEVISIEGTQANLRYDVQCSLMHLPKIFRSDLTTLSGSVPYLAASGERRNKWRRVLSGTSANLRVGLVWAGRPEHQNDRQRSIPLSRLAPLAAVAGVEYFSLQRGPGAAQAATPPGGMRLIDHTAEFESMADTAALIEQLDLVIAVDTSVAHLAGALGKPVWLLLAFVPDWRWLLDRADSPWYPQMRLFRQQAQGDWTTPIRQVADSLATMAGGTKFG